MTMFCGESGAVAAISGGNIKYRHVRTVGFLIMLLIMLRFAGIPIGIMKMNMIEVNTVIRNSKGKAHFGAVH